MKTDTKALEIIDGLIQAAEMDAIGNPAASQLMRAILKGLRVEVQELVTLCDERLHEIERSATEIADLRTTAATFREQRNEALREADDLRKQLQIANKDAEVAQELAERRERDASEWEAAAERARREIRRRAQQHCDDLNACGAELCEVKRRNKVQAGRLAAVQAILYNAKLDEWTKLRRIEDAINGKADSR